jgi:hypothetical protein
MVDDEVMIATLSGIKALIIGPEDPVSELVDLIELRRRQFLIECLLHCGEDEKGTCYKRCQQ